VFVGYSESLRDIAEVEGISTGETTYYVRRTSRRAQTEPGIRTPPLGVPVIVTPKPAPPPRHSDVLVLKGKIEPAELTRELMARIATVTAIDLDGAEFLDDELAPVLRRARAAANAAGAVLELRATRTGAKRWLSRHDLDEDT
jgi:hypothetical protein